MIAVHDTTGQAPGDVDQECLVTPLRPSVVNQDLLMASFDYRDLIVNAGPWAVVDIDGNNNPVTGSPTPMVSFSVDGAYVIFACQWAQSGPTCERITTVCGFLAGVQDNWLITQYINNTASRQMFISVKFSINALCGLGCGNVLDLFVLETSNSNQSFAKNVSNFPPTALFALTTTVRDGSMITNRILRIGSAATPGVYIAFRDQGTCVSVAEVSVYYPICDANSPLVGANFTRDGLPGETLSGTCFPNMAVNENILGGPFEAMCFLDEGARNTTWNTQCMCVPGYRFISRSVADQCEGVCVCMHMCAFIYSLLYCMQTPNAQ